MKVLYIYRHPDMGFSVGKVFRPIEQEMRRYAEVDAVYMPAPGYKPRAFISNVRCARQAARQKDYDIIHITGTEHYLLPFLRRYRTVVTVHDIGFFTHQPFNLRAIWKYCLWIKTLKLAGRVTFISEKSHEDTLRFVKFHSGQDRIVYNAVGIEFHYVPKEVNKQCPVILHIGTKPNKNLNATIIALKDLPHKLRIIGQLDDEQLNLLETYHTDYSAAWDLTDEQIVKEYEQCDIVDFPSLHEGFGQIVIEAQAVGRPVVTSNLSPMKENAAGSAVLIDPLNVESIREGYVKLLASPETYIKAGLENIKRFTIEAITKEYYSIYQDLLARR